MLHRLLELSQKLESLACLDMEVERLRNNLEHGKFWLTAFMSDSGILA